MIDESPLGAFSVTVDKGNERRRILLTTELSRLRVTQANFCLRAFSATSFMACHQMKNMWTFDQQ